MNRVAAALLCGVVFSAAGGRAEAQSETGLAPFPLLVPVMLGAEKTDALVGDLKRLRTEFGLKRSSAPMRRRDEEDGMKARKESESC